MKNLKWLSLMVLLLGIITYGQSNEVNRAEIAYLSGDYVTAILEYESITAISDPAIYYNLGMSYEQTGRLAPALLNYLRANQLAPREEQIKLAINRLRSIRQDVIGDDNDWLFITANLTNMLTLMELSIVGLVLWTIFWFSIAFLRRRQKSQFVSVGLAIIMFSFLLVLGARWGVTLYPVGVIQTTETLVMSGAGADYLPLYPLHEGAELFIIEKRDEWVRFRLADGRTGWVAEETYILVDKK